ncbi:MAG TPA: hypothetical protein VJH94_03955 [Candidatus Paceibacterota bacterium]
MKTTVTSYRPGDPKPLIFSCPVCKKDVIGVVIQENPDLEAMCLHCQRGYLTVFKSDFLLSSNGSYGAWS